MSTEHEETAKRLLPCTTPSLCDGPIGHVPSCLGWRRPDFAAALAAAEAKGAEIRSSVTKSVMAENDKYLDRINELENMFGEGSFRDGLIAAEIARLKAEVEALNNQLNSLSDALGTNADCQFLRARLAEVEKERDAAHAEAKRLFAPMNCGHPWACYSVIPYQGNEPAPLDWPKDCLACRAVDHAHAKGKLEGLELAMQIADLEITQPTAARTIQDQIDAIKAEGKA